MPVSVRQFLQIFPEKKNLIASFKNLDEPVRGITWYEAQEFCRKAGKRLPSEFEWLSAAFGFENFEYSTGKTKSSLKKARLSKIKEWPGYRLTEYAQPNVFGIFHLTGMVWEWTADAYKHFKGNNRRIENSGGAYMVLKGGSWNSDVISLRNNFRYSMPADYRGNTIGFRCAL